MPSETSNVKVGLSSFAGQENILNKFQDFILGQVKVVCNKTWRPVKSKTLRRGEVLSLLNKKVKLRKTF
jgi:hypothetical protein